MSEIEIGALCGDIVRLMRQNGARLLVAMVVLTALGMVLDLGMDPANQRSMNLVFPLATLFFQTWLTIALLEAHGRRRGGRGIGAAFWISILYAVGVLLGLVAFVIPGILLFVRWTIAIPYAFGEDVGGGEALHRSFEETRGAFWPILLALLVAYSPYLVAVAAAFVADGELTIATSLISNAGISLGLIAGWHVAIAVYLTRRRETGLAGVFA